LARKFKSSSERVFYCVKPRIVQSLQNNVKTVLGLEVGVASKGKLLAVRGYDGIMRERCLLFGGLTASVFISTKRDIIMR